MREHLDIEPIRGLPETPPEGERILWQGAPRTWALAKSACKVHWVAGYFVFMAVWSGTGVGAGRGLAAGLVAAGWLVAIGAVAVAVLTLIAWAMARATVYTLTSRRVVMRIGAALTATVNLPYQWIESASLSADRHGIGTIALELKGESRLTNFMLWPHVRPWSFGRTRPALRAIPDAAAVAGILGAAARTRIGEVGGEGVLAPPAPAAIAAE